MSKYKIISGINITTEKKFNSLSKAISYHLYVEKKGYNPKFFEYYKCSNSWIQIYPREESE